MTEAKIAWLTEDIAVIEHFLDEEECRQYIEDSEDMGFDAAAITTASGFVQRPDVRNNDRVIRDDPDIAALLWARLAPFFPDMECDGWRPIGLNERFRIYRYDPGQKFDWHRDGCFERAPDERSFWTFLIYLNGADDGGETLFAEQYFGFDPVVTHRVGTAPGKALLFRHEWAHKGDMVREGRKYVLRSDVMFRRS